MKIIKLNEAVGSVAEIRKNFKEATSIEEKANIAAEALRLTHDNNSADAGIEEFRKVVGDNSFVKWMESFSIEEATDKDNEFNIFLDYLFSRKTLFENILKIKNAIFKLYNSYVDGGMDNLREVLAKNSGENVLNKIIYLYLSDETFYENSPNEITWILKNALFNPKLNNAAKYLIDDRGHPKTYREIRSSLLKNKSVEDTEADERIVIRNNDTSKLSNTQRDALLKNIASSQEGRTAMQNAINNYQ